MIKVLHLHAGTLYGGVETFLTTLARERTFCPEMQHTFGLCSEGRFRDDLESADVAVTMLGQVRLSRPLSVRKARRALVALLSRARPDVAICHMSKPLYLFAPVLKRASIPTVYYVHGPIEERNIFDRLVKYGAPPKLMIGVSDHTVQTAQDMIFSSVPTATINYPMPLQSSRFAAEAGNAAALRAEFDTPANAVVIMQATRMNAWKGHKGLLAALALLKDIPGWVHWLVGGAQTLEEESYLASLKQIARELDIESRIRFIGQRSDVPRFLVASDIYCQANIGSEGFSLSFIEAFTAGLPIVTTDIGSAREVVGSQVGLLAPPQDAPALAHALRELITDGARRHEMSKATAGWVKSLCDPVQQIGRLYGELSRLTTENVGPHSSQNDYHPEILRN